MHLAALAASLNPLLSEAGFSTGAVHLGHQGAASRLNPLLSEAGFSTAAVRGARSIGVMS